MPPLIATVVYGFGIWILFQFDRDQKRRTSTALWLPVAWLLINGSRPLSSWLQPQAVSSSEQLLEGSPLDRSIYLGLQIAGVIVLFGRHAAVVRFLRLNASMLLFVFYCAVSISWS